MSTLVEPPEACVERFGALYYRVRVAPKLQLEYLSPAIAERTGYSVGNFYRDPRLLLTLIAPDNRPAVRSYLGGESDPAPVRLRCTDREQRIFWIEHRGAVIRNDRGEIVAYEGVCFDVTEQVEEEQSLHERAQIVAADRADRLTRLIQYISHDLRHPVVSLQMYARVLRGALDDDDFASLRASVPAIDDAAKQLDGMIQSLIDSARLDTGQPSMVFESVHLGQLVGDLARRYADAAVPRVVRASRLDDAVAETDPLHVERILNNLVSNALKYSGADEILLSVEARKGEAVLAVADRGRGIAEEDLSHLFERGYRCREAGHLVDGLGLGLYIARRLAEALGGRIWVESSPGQGSAFFVALPSLPD